MLIVTPLCRFLAVQKAARPPAVWHCPQKGAGIQKNDQAGPFLCSIALSMGTPIERACER